MLTVPRIIIIGAGAIGCFYGGKLAQAGAQVSVICRSNYTQVKTHGICIKSIIGDFHFTPYTVYAHDQVIDDTFDYVVLATKVLPETDINKRIGSLLKPHSKVVLLQNGIGIEETIHQAFPQYTLISAVTFMGTMQPEPGIVIHNTGDDAKITLGTYPQNTIAHCKELQTLWVRSGIACLVSNNIVQVRWEKLVWNATFNPISVLGGQRSMLFIVNNIATEVRKVMLEVSKIAAATGHHIDDTLIDSYMKFATQADVHSSMLQDFKANKPLEYEAILGNAIKIAHHYQVPVPRLEILYGLLKLISANLIRS